MRQVEIPAAKGFEDKNAEDVVEGNDDGDHHGRNRNRLVAEDVADKGDTHEDIVAAKTRLDHRSAPRVVLLDHADNRAEDECRQEDAARAEDHEHRLKRRLRVRDVDVVEHHEEEEHAEDHAVHVPQLFLGKEARVLDEKADGHQTKQRDDAAECDKKITQHDESPPSLVLYYSRKRKRGQWINPWMKHRQIGCCFIVYIVIYR